MRERPPASVHGPIAWARANLFNSWWSSILTVVLGYLVIHFAIDLIDWAVIHAVWSVPEGANGPDVSACRDAIGTGACWAVIGEKWRFILFGRYPYPQQWRPGIVCCLFIGSTSSRRCGNSGGRA
ncbi:MAG: hypothetical protein WDN49_26675 [Acetobacteraceae bacterium]